MEEDRDFDRFIELFKFGNPADIWRYGTTTKKLHVARSVSKLWTFPPKAKNCSLCGVYSEDILCHQITICTELRYQRQDLVNKLFQLLGHSKCTELLQLDEFQLCNILLGNDTEAEYPVNILSVSGAFLLNCRL